MNDTSVPAILLDYIEGLKTHDVARIAATMADDLVVISSGKTVAKADFLPFLHALYAGFPDWRYDHDAPERAGADAPEKEGHWWFVRWRQGGTHAGVFNMPGMAPIPAPTSRPLAASLPAGSSRRLIIRIASRLARIPGMVDRKVMAGS